jgi:hypothetical protein
MFGYLYGQWLMKIWSIEENRTQKCFNFLCLFYVKVRSSSHFIQISRPTCVSRVTWNKPARCVNRSATEPRVYDIRYVSIETFKYLT